MPRPEGSKNKPLLLKGEPTDNEDVFLSEMLRGLTFWKAQKGERAKSGLNVSLEEEYIEFYRIGLNKFSKVEVIE